MRPYWAIIKDSFRSALDSRVLYVLLGLITLILVLLAPLSVQETPQTLEVRYVVWDWDLKGVIQSKQELVAIVVNNISYYFDKVVLSIGLLIAILVTSNIIPETFEPGSLNLLLSKPVSRSALYLAKFAGGCAFVTLCAGYLFLGVWIWMGIQLEVWDRAFLLSIPIYVLVFAIYYSVSALIGLLYRNPIMAIAITVLFWGLCFAVGGAHGSLRVRARNFELIDVRPVGSQTLGINSLGEIVSWDGEQWQGQSDSISENELENMSEPEKVQRASEGAAVGFMSYVGELREEPLRLQPVLDTDSGCVLTGKVLLTNPLVINHQEFAVNHQSCYLTDSQQLELRQVGKFPRRSMQVFAAQQGPVVVTSSGNFFRLPTEKLESIKPMLATEKLDKNSFEAIGPDQRLRVRTPGNVAFNEASEEIAVYNQGKLAVYQVVAEGRYQQNRLRDLEIDFNQSMSCHVSFTGNTILLVFGNGDVMIVDAQSLETVKTCCPEIRTGIDQVCSSANGRWFALRYRNQTLRLLDVANDYQILTADVTGQGTISAVSFDDQNNLWVVDRMDRVTQYDPETWQSQNVLSPSGNWVDFAYRYVVKPLYYIFPKPSEFYKVSAFLSETNDAAGNRDVDLSNQAAAANPLLPVWSGLGFMIFMLGLSCAIFHFKDY